MSNKGFTLVELIAVIVILGIIILIGSTNVIGQLTGSKKNASNIAMKNLEDAALSYALDRYSIPGKTDFMPNSCALTTEITSIQSNSSCVKQITVQQLLDSGFFQDGQGACDKSKKINIYKYKKNSNGNYVYDFKAFIPSDTCKY